MLKVSLEKGNNPRTTGAVTVVYCITFCASYATCSQVAVYLRLSHCSSVNWWLNTLHNLTPQLKVTSAEKKIRFLCLVSVHSKTSVPNAQMSKSKSHSLLEIDQLDSLCALF